jgi:two-component system cell cycle response regulator DivK
VILDAPLKINAADQRSHLALPIERPCVLLVEDCPDARAMYRLNLEGSGFDVVEAGNGVEALLRVRDVAPDIILMDLSMPLMDGWEATRYLKAATRTAGIPVVALSGETRDGAAEGAKNAGCAAFVAKAGPPEELVKEIRKALEGVRGHPLVEQS